MLVLDERHAEVMTEGDFDMIDESIRGVVLITSSNK